MITYCYYKQDLEYAYNEGRKKGMVAGIINYITEQLAYYNKVYKENKALFENAKSDELISEYLTEMANAHDRIENLKSERAFYQNKLKDMDFETWYITIEGKIGEG